MEGIQKPFLKWVGGKTQLLPRVLGRFPAAMENYHEPFVGGGSVLLALLSLRDQGKVVVTGDIYASDINSALIDVYRHIRSNKDELFDKVTQHMDIYKSLAVLKGTRNPTTLEEAMSSKESYYYWMRTQFNKTGNNSSSVTRSALFWILNKTCFRGMYREGPNGFNVPFGHYKRDPVIITRAALIRISELLQDVKFCKCGFEDSLKRVKKGDFVYMDPPYAPATAKSFVGYTSSGFAPNDHSELFEAAKRLEEGVKLLMSNSNVALVRDAFDSYQCDVISARRAINAKNPGSTTTELLIYN